MKAYPERPKHPRLATPAILALSLVALLLWGKLKLVAAVPRTAYADPKASQQQIKPKTPAVRPKPSTENRARILGD
jgi:hypothetical protein